MAQDSSKKTSSSACSPPRRHALARKLDRAHAFSRLFDEPVEQVCIGDRYVLLEQVGGGGMGEVYAARDLQLKRKVAIKLVRSDRAASMQSDARLLREAQTLAQLSHPNVVQVYDAGYFEGRMFIAMELIAGYSLRHWLKTHYKRSDDTYLRKVLGIFADAGRGLQAAHDVDLVHRDFKPDNVLIANDDRPRVVDFGLARIIDTPDEKPVGYDDGTTLSEDEPGTSYIDALVALESTNTYPVRRPARTAVILTTRGRLMGTPRYMAPEQMRGDSTDARSDQFSFCVALYEALYGQRPFPGAHLRELQKSVESGEFTKPPADSGVPEPIYKALERGMAADPEQRFADMEELLCVLDSHRGEQPKRSRSSAFLATIIACITSGLLMYTLIDAGRPKPCHGIDNIADEWWSLDRKRRTKTAFAQTQLPYAESSWTHIENQLDGYISRLDRELITTCQATHKHGVQSMAVLESRMLCLSRRRHRLGALLDQFEHADARVVEQATWATASLSDLDVCNDGATLRYGAKPPAADISSDVTRVRKLLATAYAQELLGNHESALAIAQHQLTTAKLLGYPPLIAEALYHKGHILAYYGSDLAARYQGERMLLQARDIAEGERQDELVAEISNQQILVTLRNYTDVAKANEWHNRALAAIRRIGQPPRFHADTVRNGARIAFVQGRFAAAEAEQRHALALLENAPEAPRLWRGLYLHDLANTLRSLGRLREAAQSYDQALSIHLDEFGHDHPYVADLRTDMAMLHLAQGQLTEARNILQDLLHAHMKLDTLMSQTIIGRVHLELADIEHRRQELAIANDHAQRSLAIYREVYGKDHVNTAFAHTRAGVIAYRRGHFGEALNAYQAALVLEIRYKGEDHIDTGFTWSNIAETQLALGQLHEALRTLNHAEKILKPHTAAIPGLAPFFASVRGRILLRQGHGARAILVLERAVDGFRGSPGESMPMEQADARWALARALAVEGGASTKPACELAAAALRFYDEQGSEVHTPANEIRVAMSRWRDDCVFSNVIAGKQSQAVKPH